MAPLDILVAGAGIAGPVYAWWMKRANPSASITIVEKAAKPRTTGQAVDIRGAAVDLIKQMGIEHAVRAKTTLEEGFAVIGPNGKPKAKFPMTGNTENQGFTSEYEILRGDLAEICFDVAKDCARYIYGEHITHVDQLPNGKVEVEFANGLPKAQYDLLVAADGMISKTRRLVFGKGPNDNDYLKRLGQYGAYFTIPRAESDYNWARWYNAPKGRMIMLRPDCYGTTRAYFFVTDKDPARFNKFDEALHQGLAEQKKLLKEEFENGVGWEAQRCIEGLEAAPDFYFQMTAQVKMEEWHKGHVVLLGDAGYCPSPISGMGTASAILGAYILAGELSKINSPSEIPQALERYETVLRPRMEKVQALPVTPQLFNPQTKLGVNVLNTLAGVASVLNKFFYKLAPATSKDTWTPPTYPRMQVDQKV